MSTTTTIETRTAEITAALKALTSKSTIKTHDLPEVIQRSAIAGAEAIQNAIHAIGYHLTLDQVARFFAIIYTEEDRDAFLAAYEAAAPACYDQEADLETSAPWCCPWLTGAMGAENGDTPEALGRKAACIDYRDLELCFRAGEDSLSARTESAIRDFLLYAASIPAFLEPDADRLIKAKTEISEAASLDDEERERLTSEIVRDCIDTITPRVAMREGR